VLTSATGDTTEVERGKGIGQLKALQEEMGGKSNYLRSAHVSYR
jgi:hypothetical protein